MLVVFDVVCGLVIYNVDVFSLRLFESIYFLKHPFLDKTYPGERPQTLESTI